MDDIRLKVMERLREIHGDNLDKWLDTPNENIQGRTPRVLVDNEPEVVATLLARMEHGIPS